LDKHASADIELVGGGGGVFDIDVDGRRAYSKKTYWPIPDRR